MMVVPVARQRARAGERDRARGDPLARRDDRRATALPERVTARKVEPLVSERSPTTPTLEAIERAYILWVLRNEGGNKSRTAEVLGIDPSTLYRKLARYGVEA